MKFFLIYVSLFYFLAGCQPFKNEEQLVVNNMPEKDIRKPVVAGQFYPQDKTELAKQLTSFLNTGFKQQKEIKALVVPHAGYSFSGQVAGLAFSKISKEAYDKVIIIAPSHYLSFKGVSVADFIHYQTPLGLVPVSEKVKNILKEKNFSYLPQAHDREHAVEVVLPFLQKVFDNFEIIPLVVGNQNSLAEIKELAKTLSRYIDSKTLVIASVDFTHYGPNYDFLPFTDNIQENLIKLDQPVIDYLTNFETDKLYQYLSQTAITNDGQVVLPLLAELFSNSGSRVEVVAKDSSGNIMGDSTNSVSYVSMVIKGENMDINEYSQEERNYLLKLARQTLETYYATGQTLTVDSNQVPEKLKKERGVFVTLEKEHNLRGCIGYILPNGSIYQAVIDNALHAALEDYRFDPVTQDEVKDLTIEISILSQPVKMSVKDSSEYLLNLRPEVDGVIIKQGDYQATYLPQVWEDFKKPEEFLGSLCKKAGLNSDCWREKETELFTYQAEVLREEN